MPSAVAAVPAAAPAAALAHFEARLTFETDCADVHAAFASGEPDFVLLDVRGPAAFARGHVPGALNLPHREIAAPRLADWPAEDTVGMWILLKKRGKQLGGNSGAAFLRMVGRDTWYPTDDVISVLRAHRIIDKNLSSQRDQRAAQAAFNQWQSESGRPQAHISKVLALTVG